VEVGSGSPYAGVGDAELLDRHAAGDTAAFGELARRHRDRLWAVALRTLGHREEAADAVQDALVKAYRATRTTGSPGGAAFRGEAAVTTWLHRIVVNACLDLARRSSSRPTSPLPEDDAHGPAAPDSIAATDTSLAVRQALAQLPVEQRAALVLVDMHGWPVEEAARILQVPAGTVKSRCARGRARLVPLLRERTPDATDAAAGNVSRTPRVQPSGPGGDEGGGQPT
jgi:RNA polymerase sigma-70 factor (ECF subfamily)